MLPTPRFHHIHLNSVDPDAAIDWYKRAFPSSSKTRWGGFPALASPNDVLVLFDKVEQPPTSAPQSAIWHFGWHVTDSRDSLATYRAQPDLALLPLYTAEEGGAVLISSDSWPGKNGALGRSKAEIADARAAAIPPAGGAGFAYMRGPDDALVEYAGDYPQERFNHVHLWQEDPFGALAWYQKHLNAPIRPGFPAAPENDSDRQLRGPDRSWPALDQAGMFRSPRAGVVFGDVVLTWYPNQGDRELASSRGQLQDHMAFAVEDLDAWVDKLRGDGVTFLERPYPLGDTRAFMIEGPSREAIELVEAAAS